MKTESFNLWPENSFDCTDALKITAFIPDKKTLPWGVVVFPGGAYVGHAPHEGEGYAKFLAENGICAFTFNYRVAPHRFPYPLLDARRGVKWVRSNAEKYGIDKDKIAVMGSSAGGHLAALVSTYTEKISVPVTDSTEQEDYMPNAQILCYPVISLEKPFGHTSSGVNLLGEENLDSIATVSPIRLVKESTPPAFIWHTFSDGGVNVINSLEYAKSLKNNNVKTELHIFPDGKHGLGLCQDEATVKQNTTWGAELISWITDESESVLEHNKIWGNLLLDWLKYLERDVTRSYKKSRLG